MAGLARLCKMYGAMIISGERWVWDYVADAAVRAQDMTPERRRASDKAWADEIKARVAQ